MRTDMQPSLAPVSHVHDIASIEGRKLLLLFTWSAVGNSVWPNMSHKRLGGSRLFLLGSLHGRGNIGLGRPFGHLGLVVCDTKPLARGKSLLKSTSIATAESGPYDKSCVHGQRKSAAVMGSSIAVVLALGRLFYKTHLPSCHSVERRHGMRIH